MLLRQTLSSCGLCLLVCHGMAAAERDADRAVETGQEALRATRQPWYDAEADQLQPLELEDAASDPRRGQWQSNVNRPAWDWSWGWPTIGELLKLLAWGALFALLGYLIYTLVQAYLQRTPSRAQVRADGWPAHDAVSDEQRIENLPVNLRKSKGDLLAIAREHYETGNFSDAIVYLFSHRLLQLDKAGFIHLMKGKTNRQYLFELHASGDMQRLLGQTMAAFEDVFFGNHTIDRERFESCWKHNQQFQLLIKQAIEG